MKPPYETAAKPAPENRAEPPENVPIRKPRVTYQRSNPTTRDQYAKGWQTTSLLTRQREPLCRLCGNAFASCVHHIDGNKLNNDPSNLAPLCHHCHGVVEAKGNPPDIHLTWLEKQAKTT